MLKIAPLLRRREVWLPTAWGWLVLLVIAALVAAAVVRGLYSWLAVNEPVGAPLLVIEGWMAPQELDEAVLAFNAGRYARVVTTGGPIHRWWSYEVPRETYADKAAAYIRSRGVPPELVSAVPSPITPDDRTFHSAIRVREWAKRSGLRVEAIDLVSQGPHARRSRLLYQLAFGEDVKVGVRATRPYDYAPDGWWRSSVGAKDVWEQAMGVLWVKCFFRPPPREAQERSVLAPVT